MIDDSKILFRLPVITPQFFLESDILQTLNAIHERNLLIQLPEESRILEACAQHLLVAVADDASPSAST